MSATIPRFVIDTDVLSFLFKGDTRAQFYLQQLQGADCLISFVTVAELEQWAQQRGWGESRRKALAAHIRSYRIVHSSDELCLRWAWVRAECRRAGRPIQHADAWVAATALEADATLVTHNPTDYAGIPGLKLLTSAP